MRHDHVDVDGSREQSIDESTGRRKSRKTPDAQERSLETWELGFKIFLFVYWCIYMHLMVRVHIMKPSYNGRK